MIPALRGDDGYGPVAANETTVAVVLAGLLEALEPADVDRGGGVAAPRTSAPRISSYSKIVATLASTSSMVASGTLSSLRP